MVSLGKVIAHRGASGYCPENTCLAFDKAVELGALSIEFDVQLNAEGDAYVFHDETLNRITNGKGRFADASRAYLASLEVNVRGQKEKIMPFREALAWFATKAVQANIEIKAFPGQSEKVTLAVLREISRYWPRDKTLPLVSSFDVDALRLCHTLMPTLSLALLLDKWREDALVIAEELACVSVNINASMATASRVQLLKDKHLSVCVFTVNRQRDAHRLYALGVDSVFSNFPDLLTKPGRIEKLKNVLKNFWIKEKESPKITQ